MLQQAPGAKQQPQQPPQRQPAAKPAQQQQQQQQRAAPVVVPGPKRRVKKNYTMNDDEAERVARENNALGERLAKIEAANVREAAKARRGGGFSHNERAANMPAHESSQAMNRRKNGERIAKENQALGRRIVAVHAGRNHGSGYGAQRGGVVGPVARRNQIAAKQKLVVLDQPEMVF